MSEAEKKVMAIRHIMLHMMKLEPFPDLIEQFEHGQRREELDPALRSQLLERARKMTYNVIRLLRVLGEQGQNLEWWLTHQQH